MFRKATAIVAIAARSGIRFRMGTWHREEGLPGRSGNARWRAGAASPGRQGFSTEEREAVSARRRGGRRSRRQRPSRKSEDDAVSWQGATGRFFPSKTASGCIRPNIWQGSRRASFPSGSAASVLRERMGGGGAGRGKSCMHAVPDSGCAGERRESGGWPRWPQSAMWRGRKQPHPPRRQPEGTPEAACLPVPQILGPARPHPLCLSPGAYQ